MLKILVTIIISVLIVLFFNSCSNITDIDHGKNTIIVDIRGAELLRYDDIIEDFDFEILDNHSEYLLSSNIVKWDISLEHNIIGFLDNRVQKKLLLFSLHTGELVSYIDLVIRGNDWTAETFNDFEFVDDKVVIINNLISRMFEFNIDGSINNVIDISEDWDFFEYSDKTKSFVYIKDDDVSCSAISYYDSKLQKHLLIDMADMNESCAPYPTPYEDKLTKSVITENILFMDPSWTKILSFNGTNWDTLDIDINEGSPEKYFGSMAMTNNVLERSELVFSMTNDLSTAYPIRKINETDDFIHLTVALENTFYWTFYDKKNNLSRTHKVLPDIRMTDIFPPYYDFYITSDTVGFYVLGEEVQYAMSEKRLFDVNNYNDSVGYSLESLKIQIDSLDLLNAVLFKAKLNIDRLLP